MYLRSVAESSNFGHILRDAFDRFLAKDLDASARLYLEAADAGFASSGLCRACVQFLTEYPFSQVRGRAKQRWILARPLSCSCCEWIAKQRCRGTHQQSCHDFVRGIT